MDEGAAEPELLLHSAGEFSRRAVEKAVETGTPGQPVDPAAALLHILSEQPGEKLQILLDGERKIEVLPESLRHIGAFRADPAAVFRAPHIPAQNVELPFLHGVRSGDQREQRRLADAVRTDQANQFARRQCQRQALDADRPAVGERKIMEFHNRGIPAVIHRCRRHILSP